MSIKCRTWHTKIFKKFFIKEKVDLIGADDLKALSLIL